MSKSDSAFERARAVMPGGVSSPVRAFHAVGGTPRVIRGAKGCVLVDLDRTRYIDYIGAWGAAIAGHAHPSIEEAVIRAVRRGTAWGTCAASEAKLAEMIVRRVPGLELVRFSNSGTEAVMTAVRLARAATGRHLIVKCDGCYHGHADATLVRSGSGIATLGLPDSPGVSKDAARSTLVIPYNDLATAEAVFREHGDAIAAVIVEPVAGNMGVVPPTDGFLGGLRALTAQRGALLVFDEVMSGFRVARGGAIERYCVSPDLVTLGKIIGGGFPVGALAGGAALMRMLAPDGPVYAAGTFSGNPVTMAAGRAAFKLLNGHAYVQLEMAAARLHRGLVSALSDAGEPATVQRVGSMLTVFFGSTGVRTIEDARAADHGRFASFFQAMLSRGVHLPPSGYESWFLSLAHDDAAIDATIAAARAALVAMREQPRPAHS
ncbi:MAG: glutamate-1-semialdehyde 2,1-aminomutase [Phycisphaerae bacterium]|nr:glutamate-1-semialdehyde 2,1-aminomutase [Phycisphaerae bacterium]